MSGPSRAEYQRAYRLANAERIREQRRDHYVANRERVLERVRVWRAANQERKREIDRAYYAANRERILERSRVYQPANPERHRANDRAYRAANAEVLRERARTIRHGITRVERDALYAAQGGACAGCREPFPNDDLEIDHDHVPQIQEVSLA